MQLLALQTMAALSFWVLPQSLQETGKRIVLDGVLLLHALAEEAVIGCQFVVHPLVLWSSSGLMRKRPPAHGAFDLFLLLHSLGEDAVIGCHCDLVVHSILLWPLLLAASLVSPFLEASVIEIV